jgi:polyvinyl alcohol dehydrogenase (cytochrome)
MWAFDPDNNGKALWQVKVGNGGALGGIEWGFAADNENVYVPVADPGRSGTQTRTDCIEARHRREALECACATGEMQLGHDALQQLAIGSRHVIPGAVFSGTADGHLRAIRPKTERYFGTSTRQRRSTPSMLDNQKAARWMAAGRRLSTAFSIPTPATGG